MIRDMGNLSCAMRAGFWLACVTLMGLPNPGRGDGVPPPADEDDRAKGVQVSEETLPDAWGYQARWQIVEPLQQSPSNDWRVSITDLDFEDRSTLERVSKLRSLSLLTLAEFGKKRLFLGVDDEGVVGLHFKGFPKGREDRHFEMARMPYLESEDLDAELGQPDPDSE